jgi:hypothetical protein
VLTAPLSRGRTGYARVSLAAIYSYATRHILQRYSFFNLLTEAITVLYLLGFSFLVVKC